MTEKHITPEEFLDTVFDEKSFLKFLKILSEDWESEARIERKTPSSSYSSGALGWENGTIGAFLEAAAACGIDHLETGGLESSSNIWKKAASIIYSGKVYE